MDNLNNQNVVENTFTLEECKSILENNEFVLNVWDFDIFDLNEITNNYPLTVIGFEIFRINGLIEQFKIPEDKLFNFLYNTEKSYHRNNPYHNNIHALDVTHTFSYFLSKGVSEYLEPIEIFSGIVSAIIHDVDHPGVSNGFLINTSHPYAITYNDQSVLENHHSFMGFNIIMKPENNIFCNINEEQRVKIRSLIIYLVLGTDFAKHNKYLEEMDLHDKNNGWDKTKEFDRKFITLMCLKSADVSHGTKTHDNHIIWSHNINREFLNQGDREKELGIKVTFDRDNFSLPDSQIFFTSGACLPLFTLFVKLFPDLDCCLQQLLSNIEFWKNKKLEEKEKENNNDE
eukprot:TRINITY_DN399_c0_g1_i1.p1 TRINITY_DN399_c0_g1~~TRINITY_DN399_c0_g1_i1.p1  ORF type:complete len:344 (+),score=57.02 TRINITY_DN399_c0_g1_i1:78-1109(+)